MSVIAEALDVVTNLLASPATRVYVVPVCALNVIILGIAALAKS